jgi:low temperature requirement protein LtrA
VPAPGSGSAGAPRTWWAKPRLRNDEDVGVDRKVSFLDLFFDLVFVVAVAEIAHVLYDHPDAWGLGAFMLLFTPVWWLWIGSTFYTERFETSEVSHRLFTVLQMIPIVGIAAFAHGAFAGQSIAFAVSYIVGRAIVISLWVRGGYHDRSAARLTSVYALGFGFGVLFWIASVFVPTPLRYWLWLAGLVVDLIVSWATVGLQQGLPKLSTTRLPERFALFTIIVLGESIVGTVGGLAAQGRLSSTDISTGILGLLTAVMLWWMYFDTVGWRATEPKKYAEALRSLLHLPLAMAFTATGVGVHLVVGLEGEPLSTGARWIICGALAASIGTIWALHFMLLYEPQEHREATRFQHLMLVATFALLALGVLGGGLGPLALLASAVGVLGALVGYGSWRWAIGKLA